MTAVDDSLQRPRQGCSTPGWLHTQLCALSTGQLLSACTEGAIDLQHQKSWAFQSRFTMARASRLWSDKRKGVGGGDEEGHKSKRKVEKGKKVGKGLAVSKNSLGPEPNLKLQQTCLGPTLLLPELECCASEV